MTIEIGDHVLYGGGEHVVTATRHYSHTMMVDNKPVRVAVDDVQLDGDDASWAPSTEVLPKPLDTPADT
jgi:hypothetical protein